MKLTYNGKSSFSTFCSLLKTLQEEVQRFVRLTKMEWMMIQLQLCFPPSRERGKSPTISPLNFQRQMARRSTVQRTSTRSFDVAREFEFGFDKQTASDLSAYRSKRPRERGKRPAMSHLNFQRQVGKKNLFSAFFAVSNIPDFYHVSMFVSG